ENDSPARSAPTGLKKPPLSKPLFTVPVQVTAATGPTTSSDTLIMSAVEGVVAKMAIALANTAEANLWDIDIARPPRSGMRRGVRRSLARAAIAIYTNFSPFRRCINLTVVGAVGYFIQLLGSPRSNTDRGCSTIP